MLDNRLANKLAALHDQGLHRCFRGVLHNGRFVRVGSRKMLNLSGNDYLGLAQDRVFQTAFLQEYQFIEPFSSSSSRLLSGDFPVYHELENLIASSFQREACLLFNSGYHANTGILSALADKNTLIVADKLVHASIIDGAQLSTAKLVRYRHNDMAQLEEILQRQADKFEQVLVVTESLFSMDGDFADLSTLVALKKQFANVSLYVDEAHAVGVFGETGLGRAQMAGCIAEIDFIVGTFGKALASAGAYVVCSSVARDYLVNRARSLIFSTAQPPINAVWTKYLFERLPLMEERRHHLATLSDSLRQTVAKLGALPQGSNSMIVPLLVGSNGETEKLADYLQLQGFFCLPIRPPTVPQNTARLRFSLTADMQNSEIDELADALKRWYGRG